MKPAFRAGAVHVRVPATSANLGPGYDALGLALELCDDVVARVADDGLLIDVAGEGESVPRDESHLVVRAMRAAFDRLGGQPRGLELSCANRIPHGRGLGSSAAAIVAGILLARALVVGGDASLSGAQVLELASGLEGHPDNVAPALLGGLTVAWMDDGHAAALRLECDARVRPVAIIPPFEASTVVARGLLPASVPHGDAAFTAGRSALLVAALTGAPEHLLAGTEDRLHQQYRAPAMTDSAELMTALRGRSLAAMISGAGPTVLVLTRDQHELEYVQDLVPDGWRCMAPGVAARGGHIVPATR